MSVAIVTDSTAQISPELAGRLDVIVVPITISIDGVDHGWCVASEFPWS